MLAVAPDHPQAAANLGVAYNTAGQPTRAIAIFEKLLQQQPDQPAHHLNLGLACQEAGFIDRAVKCFRRVVTISPAESDYAQKARQALNNLETQPNAGVS